MSLLTIQIDASIESDLEVLSTSTGVPPAEYAARLLRRAVRAKRPKQVWDAEALREYAAEYGEEESALAESDREHRAQLLTDEDSGD